MGHDLDGKLSLKLRVWFCTGFSKGVEWSWTHHETVLTLLNRTVSQQYWQCISPSFRRKDWRTQHFTSGPSTLIWSKAFCCLSELLEKEIGNYISHPFVKYCPGSLPMIEWIMKDTCLPTYQKWTAYQWLMQP